MLNLYLLKLDNYINKFEYPFGSIYCYGNYVIDNLHENAVIDNAIAKSILTDIQEYYKNKPIVYISDRTYPYKIDINNYKLIDVKKLIGIAIVGQNKKSRDRAASEQALYPGSFVYFDEMESAISWAKSFERSGAVG